MAVNLDKPHLWKQDTQASVDHYNKWFMKFAPDVFREQRVNTRKMVRQVIVESREMRDFSPQLLLSRPDVLQTLRISCWPPLPADRLADLAGTSKSLVRRLEDGKPPVRGNTADFDVVLTRLCGVISTLLDREVFPWVDSARDATDSERDRASTIVADRLCSVASKEAMHRSRKIQQLSVLSVYLDSRGYREVLAPGRRHYSSDEPGTYTFFVSVPAAMGKDAFIATDAVVQPFERRADGVPVLIQAESRSSFADSRRQKSRHHGEARGLRMTYGREMPFVLMLGGYFGSDYLGAQAAEGIDWVWQHRMTDLQTLGI